MSGAHGQPDGMPHYLRNEARQGVTVSVSGAVWLMPDVAVTVMVLVPGGVPMTGFFTGAPPPPQLAMNSKSGSPASTNRRLFVLFRRLPASSSPKTIPADQAKAPGCRRATGTTVDWGAVVLMVRVVETGPPLGVTLAGEKVQLEAAGKPAQPKLTAEDSPFIGVIEIVNVALWPALIVAEEGEEEIVKSPGELPTTTITLALAGSRTASPGYSAEIV